jgi:uncharacterized protein
MYVVRSKSRIVRQDPPRSAAPAPHGEAETMVSCAQCGIHLPESEVVRGANGAAYCSEEHRRAAAAH